MHRFVDNRDRRTRETVFATIPWARCTFGKNGDVEPDEELDDGEWLTIVQYLSTVVADDGIPRDEPPASSTGGSLSG
jgi:hypothetical protein